MAVKPGQRVSIEFYGSRGTALYSGYDFPSMKFLGVKIEREKPPVKALHALFASVDGFRQWVMEGRPYLVPVEQSLAVLAVIEAIYRSVATGKTEDIDTEYLDIMNR